MTMVADRHRHAA